MDQELGLATFFVTATGRVRLWSPSAVALFRRDRDEVLGRDLREAVLGGEHREALDADAPADLDTCCDAILANLHTSTSTDDATLLLARIDQ